MASSGRWSGVAQSRRPAAAWSITREGLIDLALLVGTDFNDGVHGIGPKALALVQQHGSIEAMPAEIRDAVGDVTSLRQIYLRPDVTDEYSIEFGEPDLDGIVRSATSASLARTGHGCAGARVSAAGVVLRTSPVRGT